MHKSREAIDAQQAAMMNIEPGDLIIDTEKCGIFIQGENQYKPVKCMKVMGEDLQWQTLDGKSTGCDSISIFRKL